MPRYVVYELRSDVTRSQLDRLRDIHEDEIEGPLDLHRERVEPALSSGESEGFGFPLQEAIPVVELAILVLALEREAAIHRSVLDRVRAVFGDGDVAATELSSKRMKEAPSEWVGEETWDRLPEPTREELGKSYEALDEELASAAVLHSVNAVEHALADRIPAERKSDPTTASDWERWLAELRSRLPSDEWADVATNLYYLYQKRSATTSRDRNVDVDDAVGVVVTARKTLRALSSTI